MGLDVIAVDISDEKLALACDMGAGAVINAKTTDPVAEVKALCGGAQGVLVTAVSPSAFSQALGMLAKRGTMSLVGLPPGSFELDIFDTVLMRKTIRGSIVGTRLDLAECLQFAGEAKVTVHYSVERLEDINSIFDRMRANQIDGRVVMKV
jgi:propanol-preferring alcohol dehydrogenase